MADAIEDAPECDELYSRPTNDIVEHLAETTVCHENGEPVATPLQSVDCASGATLYSNDHGWGVTGERWNPPSEPQPSDC